MKHRFPDNFIFGTSTSAYQIETPFEHDWIGVHSRDGYKFSRTTDHEKRTAEDVRIIHSLAPHYRMSLMWSKLQRSPYAPFDRQTVGEYTRLLRQLNERGVSIMMVMHHFANPIWFADRGGWENDENIACWIDYGKQLVRIFGPFVSMWNTFNEPNLYTSMAYVAGEFPPFKKNILLARRVINNMAEAHNILFDHIKQTAPGKPVGISHNSTLFEGENLLGKIPAAVLDWGYMNYAETRFRKTDFFGMSYYARIGFDPFPITFINSPEKLKRSGKPHDDMWEYYPQGLEACILRFWNKYKKPIIITENGFCTQNDAKRVTAIKDYLKAVLDAMKKGADVQGYYHWSSWDNFEWNLGPTYQFGLYGCDPVTRERTKKGSAAFYSELACTKELELPSDELKR
ncbi:MAG: family 1 glycosylhydrolase [Chryseosolibacter sp.]